MRHDGGLSHIDWEKKPQNDREWFWVGRRLVANHSATLPCPMAFAEEGDEGVLAQCHTGRLCRKRRKDPVQLSVVPIVPYQGRRVACDRLR